MMGKIIIVSMAIFLITVSCSLVEVAGGKGNWLDKNWIIFQSGYT
jgi:hypothetical protein